MIKAVLFDLDGTLLDTSEGIFHTANYTMSALGMEPCWDEAQLRKFVGPPLKDCFRITYGVQDEAVLERCVAVYRAEYEKVGMHLCRIYDGIMETIEALHERGLKVGVCTLKYERLARMIFDEKGITGLFDTIRGTDEAGKVTKAESIKRACADLSVQPAGVLMVGDTMNDLLGAAEAGTSFAAATWGFGFTKDFKSDDCHVIGSPSSILSIIEEEER